MSSHKESWNNLPKHIGIAIIAIVVTVCWVIAGMWAVDLIEVSKAALHFVFVVLGVSSATYFVYMIE